jgi:transposase|tara:strand:- start:91 stop:378 length:288 start_codon:yes stop_codon:yes gene_type:complete
MERKKFSKSFKQEAERQLNKGEKSATVLARELGLRRNQLYKWQRQVELKGEAFFSGQGRRAPLSNVEALQRRIAELEEENAILKQAEAYFANQPE